MIICIIVPGSFPMLAWWPSWWMTTPCSRWSSSSFLFPPPLCFVGEQFYMYWISLLPTVVFMCPALASFTVSDSQHQGLMELPKVASMSVLVLISLSLSPYSMHYLVDLGCLYFCTENRTFLFASQYISGLGHNSHDWLYYGSSVIASRSAILKCKPPYMQQEHIRTGD